MKSSGLRKHKERVKATPRNRPKRLKSDEETDEDEEDEEKDDDERWRQQWRHQQQCQHQHEQQCQHQQWRQWQQCQHQQQHQQQQEEQELKMEQQLLILSQLFADLPPRAPSDRVDSPVVYLTGSLLRNRVAPQDDEMSSGCHTPSSPCSSHFSDLCSSQFSEQATFSSGSLDFDPFDLDAGGNTFMFAPDFFDQL